MIFNRILELYVLFYFCIAAHEIGHWIAARSIGLKVLGLRIGDRFLAIRFGGISVSPWCGCGGSVLFDQAEMKKKTNKQKAVFFFSGCAVNVLLLISSTLLIRLSPFYAAAIFLINFSLLLENAVPFFHQENDLRKFLRYIKSV